MSLFNHSSPQPENQSVGNISSAPVEGSDTVISIIGTALDSFSRHYQNFHGYVSIVLCIFGIASNLGNILVLTRRHMISPTNQLLTALATADLLTMLCYIPYATYFYCINTPEEQHDHSFGWVVYLLFNTYFTITTHTIAMWLTVALAVFRYIAVCHHALGAKYCNLKTIKLTIISVYVATPIVCIPNYISCSVVLNDSGRYWFVYNGFVTKLYKAVNYWLFGVVLKVAPCALLAILSTLLIAAMRTADLNRRRLMSQGKKDESERASEHCRTTAMLVAVVLCFVTAELPQGILAFMSGIDDRVFRNVYTPLGDIWDVLGLVNSAVNFILYCTMSRQFRQTFVNIFFRPCAHRWDTGLNQSTKIVTV